MSRKNSVRILACVAMLAGCTDYTGYRDSISPAAGDAQETNLALQTVTPFSKASYNTRIEMEGAKMQQAHDRYISSCDPDIVKCSPDNGSGSVGATTASK